MSRLGICKQLPITQGYNTQGSFGLVEKGRYLKYYYA